MDFNYYCKDCGSVVELEYGQTEYVCNNCKQSGHIKNLVAGWTKDARMAQLKAMHTLIANCNHEGIYERWIYLMPDGATDDDFLDIALDEKMYTECWELFLKLVAKDGMRW